FDRPVDNLVLFRDDINVLLALIRTHGFVAYEQGRALVTDRQPDAGEQARPQESVLVGEVTANRQRAGTRVHAVADKIDGPAERVFRSLAHTQQHLRRLLLGGFQLSLADALSQR